MKDEDNKIILEALLGLKNNLREIREALADSEVYHESGDIGIEDIQSLDDFTTEITEQELKALLLEPLNYQKPADANPYITNGGNDIEQLKREMIKHREETEKEFGDLKEYINHLSEMWGRHELEILKIKKS